MTRELATRPAGWCFFAIACVASVPGCGQRNAYVPPPPPDVKVAKAVERPVTIYSEFTGNTQASAMVSIRSRVQGYLDSIHFVDGSDVKEGDVLFTIDQRPYQAKLDQAKADLESKQAAVARSEALYKRTYNLFRTGASNQEDVDKDRGDWAVARAGVGQTQANLREAQLNLDWTIVHAPISGRISRRLIDIGNLVTADNTVLTTITRYDPIYAYFTVSETDRLAYLKRQGERPPGALEPGTRFRPERAAATSAGLSLQPGGLLLSTMAVRASVPIYPVQLGLANETGYPHKGDLDFADNAVDPSTGTLQLRGTFRNPPPYDLAPGLFVRIRVPIGTMSKALLVPERAIGTDQAGEYILVLGKEDVSEGSKGNYEVERRQVTVGTKDGDMRVIEKGLQPSDRFVVEGLQRAQPGSKVHPVENAQAMASTGK